MPAADASKARTRKRHVKVTARGCDHIYKSQRANGTWVFEVRHPVNRNKQRLYEVVGTRLDQAKARARQVHGEKRDENVVSTSTTFADVVVDWRQQRMMRPRSITVFDTMLRLHIEPWFARVKVRSIDKHMIQGWLAGLERKDGRDGPLSPSSKKLILSTLMLVLHHAAEMGAITAVPKIDKRRVPEKSEGRRRILSHDEERNLLAYCGPSPWLRPIITLALHQAMRLGEVAALQWEDVDFINDEIRVRYALGQDGSLGPTKGGKARTIDLMPAAREALLDLRQDSDGTGFVFRNQLGGPRKLAHIQRAFCKARDQALQVTEEGPVVFHSLRHTGISRLANNPQVELIYIRDFAGHSSLQITETYMHSIKSERTKAAAAAAMSGTKAAA